MPMRNRAAGFIVFWAAGNASPAALHVVEKEMPFPIRTCVICEEEFELRPDKPGFANRCPSCSAEDAEAEERQKFAHAGDRIENNEVNEARRKAIRDLLYRKEQ